MTEKDNQDLAGERTDWAEDRTILANERTFAGWMRTGMASVAIALGLKAVFGDFDPTWVPKAVSTFFCLIALAIFIAARNKSKATSRRLDDHDAKPQSGLTVDLITGALCTGALATALILWWL